jgi:hypothetical protein
LGFPSPAHTVTKKTRKKRREAKRKRRARGEQILCQEEERTRERERERDFTAGWLHGLDRHLILHGIIIHCFLELGLPDSLDL